MKKLLSLSIILVVLFSAFSLAFVNNSNIETQRISNLLTQEKENLTVEGNATRGVYGEKWMSVPVRVYADASFSSTYIAQLQQAIATWNSTRVGTVLTYAGTINNPVLVTNGIGVTKGPLASSSTIANTLMTCNGSTITRAVVTLNSNLTFNNGSTSSGTYYLKSVFMHELGHALGLTDNSDSSSIMCGTYTGRTSLSAGDINDLDSLY